MSIGVRADSCLLEKAHFDAKQELVESVRRKTREDMEKRHVAVFRIEARAHRIARETFAEYEPSLTKKLSRQLDIRLLVSIHEGEIIGCLEKESLSVYRSGRKDFIE